MKKCLNCNGKTSPVNARTKDNKSSASIGRRYCWECDIVYKLMLEVE